MLPLPEFKAVVRNSPLLAVDLIVRNAGGEILLGLRRNPPASNFWFVPGGRVFKNESCDVAIRRITREELGVELKSSDLHFKGVYDHIYPDNFFQDPAFNTHYILFAVEVTLTQSELRLPETQHSSYRFETISRLLADPDVHPFTKNYFSETPPNLWMFRYERGA